VSKTITDIDMNRKIKILQIIARLNIGGSAIQAMLLTQGLDPNQFQSVLVTGKVSASEGDMIYLADTYGIKPIIISDLQRDIGILNDVKAFLRFLRILNREKPDIVHTHTAKAGTIGRIATYIHNILYGDRIRVVHTFHGHVFHGYFSKIMSTMVILTERILSKISDIVIATSESQKKELVCNYRIAQASKVREVKLGVDLEPFLSNKDRPKVRDLTQIFHSGESDKIASPELKIGIIGRLVPIKNHKMFLDDHVQFCGWKKELPEVYTNLDIVALTSNNEGTAITLVEAMACSVPVIATNVGGVRDLLGNSQLEFISDGFKIFKRGILCRDNDAKGFAKGMEYLVKNKQLSKDIANVAQSFVVENYSKDRLIRDMESLYTDLSPLTKPADRNHAKN